MQEPNEIESAVFVSRGAAGVLSAALGIYLLREEMPAFKLLDGSPLTHHPQKRVGQGNIADRLSDHRGNPEILAYGELRVTWAVVATQADRDEIERYLADTWSPLAGDAFPNVVPIAVNSPFAA